MTNKQTAIESVLKRIPWTTARVHIESDFEINGFFEYLLTDENRSRLDKKFYQDDIP